MAPPQRSDGADPTLQTYRSAIAAERARRDTASAYGQAPPLSPFARHGFSPAAAIAAQARADTHPVLLRDRDDGDIELISIHSGVLMGHYRVVQPPPWGGLAWLAVGVFILLFAFGYACWHLGRSYGVAWAENHPTAAERG